MWSSSNMFLKKLITNNLCFPRSTSSSTPTPSCPAAAGLTATSDHKSSTDKQQIIKNFNTLYASSKSTTPDDDVLSSFFTSSSYSDHLSDNHPDFTTVFASQRFFFSSPGHSKSLIHQSTPPPPAHDNNDIDERNSSGPLLLSAGGVPVHKYSPDPYSDFRLSMQEMVEARVSQSKDPTENWEYLHQLLTCYLSLNPKNTHECIIKAFSDLVVNFLFDKDNDANRQNDGRRRRSVSRRLL
ncbi:hypothetical protein QQ045_013428 [Rhodiola kirilowii]